MNSPLFLAAWFPQAASTHAEQVDGPFFGMMMAALVALIVFVGLALVFVTQFKRKDQFELGTVTLRTSIILRSLWVIAALAMGLLALGAGFWGFVDQTEAPFASSTVIVTARQGDWDFAYSTGHVADSLHVAVNRPVKLILGSGDVMHSLSIPAFRLNQGIVPGNVTEAWFAATDTGTFDLQSNIYSGEGFTELRAAVVVHDAAGFDAWTAASTDIFIGRTMEEVGEFLYNTQGCAVCHTTTGVTLVGPSFKDVYGNQFETAEGTTITADDAYIKESILTPNVSVIKGFQPVMTPYAGILDDKKIEAITAWLKTLSDKGTEAAGSAETETQQEGN
jgi:cytochrome c oxidase subunit II